MKRMGFRAATGAALLLAFFVSPLHSQTFHKYVALGDSLTAAFEGGCLVERHQQRSYPKLVADTLGIADFQQPLVSEKALTSPLTGPACLGAVVAGGTITVGAVSQQGTPKNATLARPYDNLGIVGANAADLVDLKVSNPTGNTANRFGALVLRNFTGGPFEGRSAVDEANLLSPDLLTVWAGPRDVLGPVVTGVAIEGVTLTPVALFESKYTQIMTGVSAAGRTVVALNVPDVASIPFVNTIPPVVVNPATRQPVLVGGNTVPLLGPRTTSTCSTAPCPLPTGTLVTLGASPLLASGLGIPTSLGGTGQPLPDGSFSPPATLNEGVLLYPDEVALIQQRVVDLNARIASIAAANGATVVDIHSIFNDIVDHGYEAGGGIVLTADFLTGGIFSADGVHASNLGYFWVATEIIRHLNDVEGADAELPDFAQALFEPDVPVITATGVVDPAAGPFGFSAAMWKDLVASTGPADFETVFPGPGKRAKKLSRP
ncbi:MAG TPA: SGNH/GDSL hydrolase family protein [Thermoanaerobaculia bacterium]|nr:SGNH/GDSL hydrolase family protein [Thermoanaerobaculia bacterium]